MTEPRIQHHAGCRLCQCPEAEAAEQSGPPDVDALARALPNEIWTHDGYDGNPEQLAAEIIARLVPQPARPADTALPGADVFADAIHRSEFDCAGTGLWNECQHAAEHVEDGGRFRYMFRAALAAQPTSSEQDRP